MIIGKMKTLVQITYELKMPILTSVGLKMHQLVGFGNAFPEI
jgi:hypothetical protein